SDIKEMWTKDPFDKGFIVQQKIEERTPAHLQRIVLVVDTSATMLANRWQVQTAVKSLPPELDAKLLLADTDIIGADKWLENMAPGPVAINNVLDYAEFAGGADNMPALLKAWDLAAAKPGNNAIVWIHDPQRMLIRGPEELKQRWNNRPYGPTLYSVQATRGADEIEKMLDGVAEVKSVARTGNLEQDLKDLFARLTGQMKTYEYVRSSKKLDKKLTAEGVET